MENDELKAHIEFLLNKLDEARADIERLTLDVHLLTEELKRERRPKMDER